MIRCPFCRSGETSWASTSKGDKRSPALACADCGRHVDAPKHEAAPNYEHEEHAWRASTWGNYPGTGRFVRKYGDGENPSVIGSEGEALLEVIEARGRPLEIEQVRRVFAGAVGLDPGPVEIEILGALALFLWGAKPRFSKSWYRRDPKRSRFNRLGEALRFHAGSSWQSMIGVSSGGWRSSNDGVRLQLAETRRPAAPWVQPVNLKRLALVDDVAAERLRLEREVRRTGGMRTGLVHATVSSSNGSTGGARGASNLELEHDISRAIRAALAMRGSDGGPLITPYDVKLLCLVHEEQKPNRRAAIERVLADEGLIDATTPKAEVDALYGEHRHRIGKRIGRAERALEKALRALPKHAFVGSAPGDERLPAALQGLLREPDLGLVPLLRPGESDEEPEREESEREERPEVAKVVDSVPLGFWFGVAS